MGTLKPGATYVYERTSSEVYAREHGSTERKLVGYTYDGEGMYESKSLHDQLKEQKMWGEIHRMAKTNPALQKALDRVIMIYRLSKDNPL